MINNRFNVVYHLLGLVKLLFYKIKYKSMKAKELFEMYKNFNTEEKIEFDKLYHKHQEERFSYINSKLHKRFIKPLFPIDYVNNFLKSKQ